MSIRAETQITMELVRQARSGVRRENNSQLTHYGKVPPEYINAKKVILVDNRAGFERWLQGWLSEHPRVHEMFGDLIETRMMQKDPLKCPIFDAICDESQGLERRLERTWHIPGVEEIKREHRPSSIPAETDRTILNLWAEILILDFMLQLGFSDIRRVPKQKLSHLDIMGQYDDKRYAIEVTRKQEITNWQTVPYGNQEDCEDLDNYLKICQSLLRTLATKNKQLSKALDAGSVSPSMVKVLAIKTSDFGFSQCADQVEKIAQMLLVELNFCNKFDCIWFVPNAEISESRWICKDKDHLLKNLHV